MDVRCEVYRMKRESGEGGEGVSSSVIDDVEFMMNASSCRGLGIYL